MMTRRCPPTFIIGVVFTRADRDDINTMEDLKGKVIGALEIGDFAGVSK
jgi:hypothetical protein